jgi:myb proto-oncogene protein
VNYLSPDICKGPWSEADEALLCEKVIQFGHSWKRIASFFSGRSEVNVKSHWNQMQKHAQKHFVEAARTQFPMSSPSQHSICEDDFYFCDFDPWFTL